MKKKEIDYILRNIEVINKIFDGLETKRKLDCCIDDKPFKEDNPKVLKRNIKRIN